MTFSGEARRTNTPSNTKAKETSFSLPVVLLILIYPTLLGFVFAARLAMFALVIPTPTVPGAPPSDAAAALRGSHDLWETKGAGAVARTSCAFASIAVVHMAILFHFQRHIIQGRPGASDSSEPGYVWGAPTALWFTTTCFFVTYTTMARYGAHLGEWFVTGVLSFAIFLVTVASLSTVDHYKTLVEGPDAAIA